MRIITCNIRGSNMADGENQWSFRKELCIGVLRKYKPDIICFQEMCANQHDDVAAAFPGFGSFGIPDEPVGMNPFNSIFFKKRLFRMIAGGGYWLSEKPHVAGSKSWDSCCIRLANWVRLVCTKNQKEFRIANTHLDHISQPARENQARLICEDAAAFPDDYLQILTGDMNCNHMNPAIQLIKKHGWIDTCETFLGQDDNPQTFHEFLGPKSRENPGKIDWIFVKGGFKVQDAGIIRDSENRRYPTDHYLVYADIEL